MSEPALKIATDYVRLAFVNFSLGWTPEVKAELGCRGLTLTDLTNALRCCNAQWTDKQNASDALFFVVGQTTDDGPLEMVVRIDPNRRHLLVEEIV